MAGSEQMMEKVEPLLVELEGVIAKIRDAMSGVGMEDLGVPASDIDETMAPTPTPGGSTPLSGFFGR